MPSLHRHSHRMAGAQGNRSIGLPATARTMQGCVVPLRALGLPVRYRKVAAVANLPDHSRRTTHSGQRDARFLFQWPDVVLSGNIMTADDWDVSNITLFAVRFKQPVYILLNFDRIHIRHHCSDPPSSTFGRNICLCRNIPNNLKTYEKQPAFGDS
jgi:hypothetical protein